MTTVPSFLGGLFSSTEAFSGPGASQEANVNVGTMRSVNHSSSERLSLQAVLFCGGVIPPPPHCCVVQGL